MSTFFTGIVKNFNDKTGIGSIEQKNGPDVFVQIKQSINSCGYSNGRNALKCGQRVQFTITRGIEGPKAENLTILG